MSGYLIIFNTLLSHAHDTRCARLMAPVPDGLNFVAYVRPFVVTNLLATTR